VTGVQTCALPILLVYYNGDNSLSLAGYNDIRDEMETVPYGPDLVTAVLYDGNGDQGTPSNTLRGLIQYDSDTTTIGSPLLDVGELDMGNPSTLEHFIEWGTATYPATHYALVMSDHGAGYIGFGDGAEVLEMSEIRTALSNAGVHFDLIGFDCCVTGMAEVAYDVRQWSNVFVASEAETPLDGWPFDTVLGALNSNPAMSAVDLGRTIVSKFGAANGAGSDTTISSILTSQLSPLATAIDTFANTSLSTATASDWTALRSARNAAQAYDPPSWGEHFRDLAEFMFSVWTGSANATIRAAAENVLTALGAAVDANYHGSAVRGNGLSIELPALGAEIHPDYNAANVSFVAETHWKDFLVRLTGEPELSGYDCYVPDQLTWGQTFNVQGQVRNLGLATVTAPFYQDFYLSKNQVWGDADDVHLGWYDHQDDVPASGYGPDFNHLLTLPASPPAGYSLSGTFYIGMKTDGDNEIHEADETNNGPGDYGQGWDWDSFTLSLPDLIGLDCYVPEQITWGQTFTVQGQVRNYGPTTVMPPFYEDFFLSKDQIWGNADDVWLGYYDHEADVPAGGDGPDFNFSLTLPASPPAGYSLSGTFYIGMKTDSMSEIPESNETNNGPGNIGQGWDWDSFTLPPPDLVGLDCYVPEQITWGQTFTVQGQVRNYGLTTVTPSFYQAFYLSNDNIWGNADDLLLGYYNHQADVPASGDGPDFNFSLTLPASPPAGYSLSGTFYIGMKTDALNEIVESSETNNGPGDFGNGWDWDSFTLPPPDLVGYDCYVPDSIAWGQTFSLQGQVRNLGPTTVTPSFSQRFYLSSNQVWGDADDVLLGTYDHQADVPAGDFGPDFNVSLTLPASAPAGYTGTGPFYIGMMTDALNEIVESIETNNGPGYWWQTYDWDSFTAVSVSATRTWDGGNGVAGNNWMTAANWVDDIAPVAGDRLVFAGATQTSTNNNFPTGTIFDSITFVNGGFALSGNSVKLSPMGGVAIANVSGQNRIDLPITSDSTGTVIMQAGTLQLGLNAHGLVLSGGGADIQRGKLVFDYNTPGGVDPATTIKTLLTAGWNGGVTPWTTGKFQSSTAVANGTTLGWIDNPATSQVTVMACVPADFNLDGTVNLADLNIWKANFGIGMVWAAGDTNYDGAVNLADLNAWKSHFGQSFAPNGPIVGAVGSGAGAPVPQSNKSVLPAGKVPRGADPALLMVAPAIYAEAGLNPHLALAAGIDWLPVGWSQTSNSPGAQTEPAWPSHQTDKSNNFAAKTLSNVPLPATLQAAHDAAFAVLEEGRVSIVDGLLEDRAAELDLGHVGVPKSPLLQPSGSRGSTKT
jgi:hypothetical protein